MLASAAPLSTSFCLLDGSFSSSCSFALSSDTYRPRQTNKPQNNQIRERDGPLTPLKHSHARTHARTQPIPLQCMEASPSPWCLLLAQTPHHPQILWQTRQTRPARKNKSTKHKHEHEHRYRTNVARTIALPLQIKVYGRHQA